MIKKIFTDQERLKLIERFLLLGKNSFLEDISVRVSHFQSISSSFDGELVNKYLEKLKPLFESVGKKEILNPVSWEELISLYQKNGNGQELNLARSYLYVDSMKLLERRTPSIEETIGFMEMVPRDLLFNSEFQNKLQNKLKKYAKEYAQKNAGKIELSEVIDTWQILSRYELIYPDVSGSILEILVSRVEGLNDGTDEGRQRYLATSQRLLEGGHTQDPHIRKRLIAAWTNGMVSIYGLDQGDTQYGTTITKITDEIKIGRIDRADILRELAKKLQAQNNLSKELQKRAYEVTGDTFTQNELYQIFTDASIDLIRKSPEHRRATLDFLTTPVSNTSCHEFLKKNAKALEFVDKNNPVTQLFVVKEEGEEGSQPSQAYKKQFALAAIRHFYENFWAAPIEARAVLTRELLISPAESLTVVDKETFDYAVAKIFRGSDKYDKETQFFLRAYIDALPHYQKHLCLGAILAAAEKQGVSELRLGETLAYFLESMGPAETKFGQAAQSHPLVPEEIRNDLKRLKFRASEPDRWEVTQEIENVRLEIQQQYQKNTGSGAVIERIGDVIGSGSINVVTDVKMSDGNSYVLSMIRPHAEDRGHAGFGTMRRMADNLNLQDAHQMVQTVRELIDQANERLALEVNCEISSRQYANAKEIYKGTSVTVDKKEYHFDSADIIASGHNFFLMSKIFGDHYIELPETSAEEKLKKKNYAKAILTLELNNKLNGKFDPDRHGGNIKIEGQNIGHFDFKSMALQDWSYEGYRQFIKILTGVINKVKTPKQFFSDLVEQERLERERLTSEGKSIDPFVTEVSKGLLTDGEYAQILDKHDLMCVIVSALLGGIHPDMQKVLLETLAEKVPDGFKSQYIQDIEPGLKKSLESGELDATLEQFLPMKIKKEDLIKIKRFNH